MSAEGYVIRARFAGRIPSHLEGLVEEDAVYLGQQGRWAPADQALTFESFRAGEQALNEKWNSLRLAGDRSTILTISRLS